MRGISLKKITKKEIIEAYKYQIDIGWTFHDEIVYNLPFNAIRLG